MVVVADVPSEHLRRSSEQDSRFPLAEPGDEGERRVEHLSFPVASVVVSVTRPLRNAK